MKLKLLKKCRHFLFGRLFQIVTDQEALSYIFYSCHTSKINNSNILLYCLELPPFSLDIQYGPGKDNFKADAFS